MRRLPRLIGDRCSADRLGRVAPAVWDEAARSAGPFSPPRQRQSERSSRARPSPGAVKVRGRRAAATYLSADGGFHASLFELLARVCVSTPLRRAFSRGGLCALF